MKYAETRPYRMNVRAEAAQATGEAILDAAIEAFSSRRFDDVTLQDVAAAAGVSGQTVIRRFGSKDGLFDAVADRERARIAQRREVTKGADLTEAVAVLVDHYEQDGRTVLHLLAEEDRSPKVAAVVQEGRAAHRQWVQDQLGELFAGSRNIDRRRLVDAAVAATDLYAWKLLRLDLRRNAKEVTHVMLRLLDGLSEVAR